MSAEPSESESSISLGGLLLLATPSLTDGIFDRSVIYIVEHSSTNGALGIILNHPTKENVFTHLPEAEYKTIHRLPVHQGGPLQSEGLIFTHFSQEEDKSISIDLETTPERAAKLMTESGHIVSATQGYSAWSPGQLEGELIRNTWFTSKPTSDLLTHPHNPELWKTLLTKLSSYHELLSNAPREPFLN